MSDNAPSTPPVPPTPGEPVKVQPKKETVRIALPPKPTAAPTVRLPSPAAGGAPPAPGAPAAARPAPSAAPAPMASAPKPATAAPAAPAAAPAAMPRPMSAPIASGGGVSGLDKGLSIAGAILALGFLIHVVIIALGITVE